MGAGTTLDLILNKSKPEGNANANNNISENHLKKPSETDDAVVESVQDNNKMGMEDLNKRIPHSEASVIPVTMVKESSGGSYTVTQVEKKPGKLFFKY